MGQTATGKYHEWLQPDGLLKIEGWARDGLTDEQIAHNMGINRATLYSWKNKYSDISDALKKGKEVVDRLVENALLKRALGYKYTEVTKERVVDEYGERLTVTKEVTKEVAPDTTAQIFWLKNRKPEIWRGKDIVEQQARIDKLQAEVDRLRGGTDPLEDKIGKLFDAIGGALDAK